ncbi:hypothetical protein I7I50_09358 [Histoplasma capsulatum G186AR]|uniref:Uncharacterized protein n=1 Tax=Ajellomyces capsulatus TaxID=5037 RepID=A0A8H7YSA6_AJECA|nr:hypothetical protein I7I52_06879 [Histoplasma capsulatum]QSS74258.1 hypothetical protein I7I50_09358 [Histoplasma capsulatum G186AR]
MCEMRNETCSCAAAGKLKLHISAFSVLSFDPLFLETRNSTTSSPMVAGGSWEPCIMVQGSPNRFSTLPMLTLFLTS